MYFVSEVVAYSSEQLSLKQLKALKEKLPGLVSLDLEVCLKLGWKQNEVINKVLKKKREKRNTTF